MFGDRGGRGGGGREGGVGGRLSRKFGEESVCVKDAGLREEGREGEGE